MHSTQLSLLIQQCQQNNTKAFRQLVVEYQGLIFSLAFRMLQNEEEAKDITQETFIKAWTNIHHFDHSRKFSTWIYAIASHLCLDKLKSARHQQNNYSVDLSIIQDLTSSETSDKPLLNKELGIILQQFTSELTPKQQLVFTLRYFEELEVDEITEITGLSAEKIKSNLYLAKQTIRKKLENY